MTDHRRGARTLNTISVVAARLPISFLFAMRCVSPTPAPAQETPAPPVLTVCEALRNFNLYRGKDVVIVGSYGWTFEGNFMHEKCDPDDLILIQGHRWLSMIAVWPTDKSAEVQSTFPVDEAILRKKLSEVNDYHVTVQGISPPEIFTLRMGGWDAVYGRLDSPAKLKPYVSRGASNPRNIPGTGYGANGTVPVRILVVRQKSLD
jgi:hypothetical protein